MTNTQDHKESILEALAKRPLVSDGSYIFTLERRGYILAGNWTPEMILKHPDAVKQLHREYVHVGADIIQAFTFGSTGTRFKKHGVDDQVDQINSKACKIAQEIAKESDVFICGGISPTGIFDFVPEFVDKQAIALDISGQLMPIIANVDYILIEFFFNIDEMEVAIDVCKQYGKPVAASMRVGPPGDQQGRSAGECAVRMAKAGADIVGVNCSFDPKTSLETMKLMKAALDKEGLSPFLMMQPVGYHTQDLTEVKDGYHMAPEFPFCVESRGLTRFDVIDVTREAYELGVRYFGGCCGHEPYHMREIAYELRKETGKTFPGAKYHKPYGENMAFAAKHKTGYHGKDTKEFWQQVCANPSSGRQSNK